MIEGILEIVLQYIFEIGVFLLLGVCGIVVGIILTGEFKTWVKTTVFLVIAEGFSALLGWSAYLAHTNEDLFASVAAGIIAALMAVVSLYIAVVQHKRGWKNIDM